MDGSSKGTNISTQSFPSCNGLAKGVFELCTSGMWDHQWDPVGGSFSNPTMMAAANDSGSQSLTAG